MTGAPLRKLNNVISFVWQNPHSHFYPDLWGTHGINDMPVLGDADDLEKLPLLSREAIGAVQDPLTRLHVERRQADALFSTSGTSGRRALFFWTIFPEQKSRMEPYLAYGATKLMSFNSYHKFMMYATRAYAAGLGALAGDAHNLPRSAELVNLAGVDTLYIPATLALMFADHLDRINRTDDIKVLVLWGEYCSDITYALLKERYPKAHFVFEYTLAEIGGCLAQSTEACTHPTHIKHIDENGYFVEIVNGELIVTTLGVPGAFPHIRYRTGDGARFVEGRCACGREGQTIELLGRIGGDFVRIGGAEIRAEELERVLEEYHPFIEPTYCLEVGESKRDSSRVATLHLMITMRANVNTSPESLKTRIMITFMDEMRLSQNMNLGGAVNAGLFDAPTISFVEERPTSIKHSRLIQKF